ncbi:MAG: hypothetical protein EB132_03335 [Actinobacteria bacterium]|nr:hypothetical protein [Actinomycetota bacterium]
MPGRDLGEFVRFTERLLGDSLLSLSMGTAAAERAKRYSWKAAATTARTLFTDLRARDLVACS